MTSPALIEAHTLLPCPFCGGEAERLTLGEGEPDNAGGDVITCTRCQASSHVEFGRKENLVDRWNCRVAADPELLVALKAALVILDELDEYQKRPESGSYDAECACCMGELFDNGERQTMDQIRAAIAKALGQ